MTAYKNQCEHIRRLTMYKQLNTWKLKYQEVCSRISFSSGRRMNLCVYSWNCITHTHTNTHTHIHRHTHTYSLSHTHSLSLSLSRTHTHTFVYPCVDNLNSKSLKPFSNRSLSFRAIVGRMPNIFHSYPEEEDSWTQDSASSTWKSP